MTRLNVPARAVPAVLSSVTGLTRPEIALARNPKGPRRLPTNPIAADKPPKTPTTSKTSCAHSGIEPKSLVAVSTMPEMPTPSPSRLPTRLTAISPTCANASPTLSAAEKTASQNCSTAGADRLACRKLTMAGTPLAAWSMSWSNTLSVAVNTGSRPVPMSVATSLALSRTLRSMLAKLPPVRIASPCACEVSRMTIEKIACVFIIGVISALVLAKPSRYASCWIFTSLSWTPKRRSGSLSPTMPGAGPSTRRFRRR